MKLVIIDNYDSFTYNLVHAFRCLGVEPDVFRNDKFDIDDLARYDKIVVSPGPGIPEEAGLLMPMLRRWIGSKPILGVCLGHQAIAEAVGAQLVNLPTVYHGLQDVISLDESDYIFENLPQQIAVGRYHSWAVDNNRLPECIEVTATDSNGIIMALRHRDYDVRGLQFHPESVLTPQGNTILKNWLTHNE